MALKSLERVPRLKRYTDLAAAIHVLETRSLTLLDPEKWDDGNDRAALAEYKKRKDLKTLLALCFADCDETYHHWKVFASGVSGVCIEFKKHVLLSSLDGVDDVQHRSVDYRTINILRRESWDVNDLPFIKRAPYKPESEYRLIYGSAEIETKAISVAIEIDWIDSIKLSPWMPKALHDPVRTALRRIKGCSKIPVQSTSLIDSDTWKRSIERAT